MYALAGTVALSAIAQWVIDDRIALRVIGGIFLVIWAAARSCALTPLPPPGRLPHYRTRGAQAAFMSTFLLTLGNPVTLLGFAAMFAGLGVAPVGLISSADSAAAALVLGVFLGSALWWLALSSLIGRVRHASGRKP